MAHITRLPSRMLVAPVAAILPGRDGSNVLPTDEAIANAIEDSDSSTSAALAASFAASRTNTMVTLGNSLDALCGQDPSAIDPVDNVELLKTNPGRGWWTWFNALTGNQTTLVHNGGVGGETTAGFLARVQTDCLDYDPAFVALGDPINDIDQGRTFAQIKASYESLLTALAGRVVIVRTATPAASVLTTTGKKTILSQINDWLRNLPRTHKGVLCVDAWSVIADRTNAGAAATGMTIFGANSGAETDNLHWSPAGAFRVGQLYATALAPWLASAPTRGSWNGDPKAVIAAPSFSSGWSKQGGSDTAIDTSASDGKGGKKLVITVTGATTDDERGAVYNQDIDSGGLFAPGDIVQATFNVSWTGLTPLSIASYCGPQVIIRQRQEGGGFAKESSTPMVSGNQMVIPTGLPSSGSLTWTSQQITIISHSPRINLLYIYVEFVGAAAVTATVTDLAFVKVN